MTTLDAVLQGAGAPSVPNWELTPERRGRQCCGPPRRWSAVGAELGAHP